jgi:hypothetical protein
MNIILIAENNHYRDWKGKTYYDILTHYTKNSNNKVTLFFTDENYSPEIIKNFNPDIIIHFETNVLGYAKQFIFNLNIPVFYCGLDLYYLDICKKCNNIQQCAGIIQFSKSIDLENSYKRVFPDKIMNHFSGRFINSNIYKNYNEPKKYDVLIYGTRNYLNNIEEHDADQQYKLNYDSFYGTSPNNKCNFYPLRTKIERIVNSQKYRICIVQEACIYDAPVANEELSRLINQSHLTLACRTRADIAMSKYFEIAASYSAILGDIPSDYVDLFKGNIVEVTEWMSDDKIIQIIDKALEDKEKLWEMTQRLGDRVHKEYNLEAGTKNMDEVIEQCVNLNKLKSI